MSHINLENVHKSFDSVEVLKGIDLRIQQGSVLALLGPSGCGKTTLLRLIAGFDPINQGRILFGEKLMASPDRFVPPERRRIGYVPQEGALFPHLTVAGNIRYGIPRHMNQRQRVAEVLELIGLQDYAKRYPHELSGGQQQRVALGRALAPDPTLVLLDEPFNALDLDLRRSMCEDVVQLLRQTNTTAVLVTHDPGEAFAASDQLAVMLAGQIVQCDHPESVYWKPDSEVIARLTGDTIVLPGIIVNDGIQCALGVVSRHASCKLPTGVPVSTMIRPEQVSWQSDAGKTCQSAAAVVTKRSFRGSHTLVDVELADLCLSLHMPSLTAPARNETGALRVTGCCMAYPET